MGHTLLPIRMIVYSKLDILRKLCNGMREPERSTGLALIYYVHQHISAITYANPMPYEIDHAILLSMLLEQKKKYGYTTDDTTLELFAVLIRQELRSQELHSPELSSQELISQG